MRKSSRWQLSRRHALQLLGLSTVALPSLARAAPWSSAASRAPAPAAGLTRLLVYFMTQGTYYPNWRIDPENAGDKKSWNISLADLQQEQFSACLEPLYPMRKQLVLLDGIGMGTSAAYGRDAHHCGHAAALSGARPKFDGSFVTSLPGPSLDQLIATKLSGLAPIDSLHYGPTFQPIAYDHHGRPIPSESNAMSAFERLFPGLPNAQSASGGALGLEARTRALEFAAMRTASLASFLSGEDRQKLQTHVDRVLELASQLTKQSKLMCEAPASPGDEPADPTQQVRWRAETWEQLGLVALTCGHSRVVSVYDAGPNAKYLDVPGESIHTQYAHTAGLLPESNEVMTKFYRYYAQRINGILEQLAAVPEGEGTMLDHTLVLVVNELGSPNHDPMDYPMILAGGGSAWSTGRYLFYPKDRTIHGRLRDYLMGPSHQHVLVSVAQAFGLDVNAVGETELPGPDGSVVNTEGPLAGLL